MFDNDVSAESSLLFKTVRSIIASLKSKPFTLGFVSTRR